MASIPKIPRIADDERTTVVVKLLEIIGILRELIQGLGDEIARLKRQKSKPKIKPSTLEKTPRDNKKEGVAQRRPGSSKLKKTGQLKIHEEVVLKPESVPDGSRFKGYEEFASQGIVCQAHNILYRRQRWVTPDGKTIVASLPENVRFIGGHFDVSVFRFVLNHYYHCAVTQPLILEQLREMGTDISAGQINRIIVEDHDRFHEEKDEILRVGLEISDYVNVDDTGARHKGKNGYCTHIGNELFAWFESSFTKSRINFLGILRAGNKDYVLHVCAYDYMEAHNMPKARIEALKGCGRTVFEDSRQWNAMLESLGMRSELQVRVATEAALLGSIREHGCVNPNLVIVSDDAGRFDVLLHALCWIHAERSILRLLGFNKAQREALENVRTEIWDYLDPRPKEIENPVDPDGSGR